MFLVIIAGSSGAGKNTVMEELFQKDNKFKKFVTYTTRDKRPGEIEDVNYHYVTVEEFKNKLDNNEILEYEIIHDNMYGSSLPELLDLIKNQGYIVINDFGVEGTKNIKEKLKGKIDVVTIYLNVPKDELKKRLVGRGDKADSIKRRMERYDYELSFSKDYDYVINNINLDETVDRIYRIIKCKQNDLEIQK